MREGEEKKREEKRDREKSALKWRLLSHRQSQSKVQQVLDARTSMLHVYACIVLGAREKEGQRERGICGSLVCIVVIYYFSS